MAEEKKKGFFGGLVDLVAAPFVFVGNTVGNLVMGNATERFDRFDRLKADEPKPAPAVAETSSGNLTPPSVKNEPTTKPTQSLGH